MNEFDPITVTDKKDRMSVEYMTRHEYRAGAVVNGLLRSLLEYEYDPNDDPDNEGPFVSEETQEKIRARQIDIVKAMFNLKTSIEFGDLNKRDKDQVPRDFGGDPFLGETRSKDTFFKKTNKGGLSGTIQNLDRVFSDELGVTDKAKRVYLLMDFAYNYLNFEKVVYDPSQTQAFIKSYIHTIIDTDTEDVRKNLTKLKEVLGPLADVDPELRLLIRNRVDEKRNRVEKKLRFQAQVIDFEQIDAQLVGEGDVTGEGSDSSVIQEPGLPGENDDQVEPGFLPGGLNQSDVTDEQPHQDETIEADDIYEEETVEAVLEPQPDKKTLDNAIRKILRGSPKSVAIDIYKGEYTPEQLDQHIKAAIADGDLSEDQGKFIESLWAKTDPNQPA